MNVIVAEPAQVILRNLSDEGRRKVWAWIDHLKRWDTDPFARQHPKKLDTSDNVYMLLASTDIRIFFALEEDTITVLDLARKSTIIRSGQVSGGGRP